MRAWRNLFLLLNLFILIPFFLFAENEPAATQPSTESKYLKLTEPAVQFLLSRYGKLKPEDQAVVEKIVREVFEESATDELKREVVSVLPQIVNAETGSAIVQDSEKLVLFIES